MRSSTERGPVRARARIRARCPLKHHPLLLRVLPPRMWTRYHTQSRLLPPPRHRSRPPPQRNHPPAAPPALCLAQIHIPRSRRFHPPFLDARAMHVQASSCQVKVGIPRMMVVGIGRIMRMGMERNVGLKTVMETDTMARTMSNLHPSPPMTQAQMRLIQVLLDVSCSSSSSRPHIPGGHLVILFRFPPYRASRPLHARLLHRPHELSAQMQILGTAMAIMVVLGLQQNLHAGAAVVLTVSGEVIAKAHLQKSPCPYPSPYRRPTTRHHCVVPRPIHHCGRTLLRIPRPRHPADQIQTQILQQHPLPHRLPPTRSTWPPLSRGSTCL